MSPEVVLEILEQIFGAEPFDQPRLDDLPPGLERDDVPLRGASDVSLRGTSEVPQKARNNRERNREANTRGRRPRNVFEPVETKERGDDVLYVEH